MYRNCKWPPTWRHPCLAWLACLTCMCVRACVCMRVHVCVHGIPPYTPIPTPTPIHPSATPPGGCTPRISKNSITLELIKIFQFRLKIWNLWKILHPWVGVWFGGWVGGWVGWWVGSGQNTKNSKKCWLNQDNSILFEDLWFVETPPPTPPPIGGWVGGSVGQWVGSGQMTKILISFDLIKIIQFSLKIYDL